MSTTHWTAARARVEFADAPDAGAESVTSRRKERAA
jgi:hypothetical protein